ncbi:DUF5709 domain-containing protein [Nocardioides yefusunii]|uniref:DUF5709 domain-containing protein n=1 Tax=Nocardioides yefusunii TaxID=2500546 RepID=A0ABW1QXY0_9ACTN|nr:DUF5709 domain-containing protein [Nocardioides yefusunii]
MSDPDTPDVYGEYSVDEENQPHGDGDSQVGDRGLKDPLEEGYSPPEKWSVAQGFGNTPAEALQGESLEQRMAQEEPEPDPYAAAEAAEDLDLEPVDDGEVGDERSGRLADRGEGASHVLGEDVGIDGAGASAEEAAMHVVHDIVDPDDLDT